MLKWDIFYFGLPLRAWVSDDWNDDFAYLPTYLSFPNFEIKWVG